MANYSTIARVRQETGFVGNQNISDTYLQSYLDRATSIVKGWVANRYVLTALAGATFTGSQAEATLKGAEELLASGYLLIAEYGAEVDGDKNGYKKVEQAEKMLKQIADGTIKLVDTTGVVFLEVSANSSFGAPVTPMPSLDVSPRKFSVDTKY